MNKVVVNRSAVCVALCARRAQGKGCGEKKEGLGRVGRVEGVYGEGRGVWGPSGPGS